MGFLFGAVGAFAAEIISSDFLAHAAVITPGRTDGGRLDFGLVEFFHLM
jgi:hypothetical protein